MMRFIEIFIRKTLVEFGRLIFEIPYRISFSLYASLFIPIFIITMKIHGSDKFASQSFAVQLSFMALLGAASGGILFSISMLHLYHNSRVLRPPASRLAAFLKIVFPKRAYDRIFSQIVIDFRDEHLDMLAQRRFARARWISICLVGTLLITTAVWISTVVVKQFASIWRIT